MIKGTPRLLLVDDAPHTFEVIAFKQMSSSQRGKLAEPINAVLKNASQDVQDAAARGWFLVRVKATSPDTKLPVGFMTEITLIP